MAGTAFREDALRQRPASGAAGLRACRAPDPAVRRARGRDRRLDGPRHDRGDRQRPRRLRRLRGRRQRGRGRPVLCLDRVRNRRAARRRQRRLQGGLRRPRRRATGKARPSCAGSRRRATRRRGAALARCRAILFAARAQRIRPGRDDKVLADWNGLAIAALCRAAAVFGRPDWLDRAAAAFDFIWTHMPGPGERVQHAWRLGRITAAGLLDDQAAWRGAALALYEATGATERLEQATRAGRASPTPGSPMPMAATTPPPHDAADVPSAPAAARAPPPTTPPPTATG